MLIFGYHPPFLFLRWLLSLAWNSPESPCWVTSQLWRLPVFGFPGSKFKARATTLGSYMWVLGIELRSLCGEDFKTTELSVFRKDSQPSLSPLKTEISGDLDRELQGPESHLPSDPDRKGYNLAVSRKSRIVG